MRTAIILSIALLSSFSLAAVSIVDHNSSAGWEVTTANAIETVSGRSRRVTFASHGGPAIITSAPGIAVYVEAGPYPFYLLKWCVSVPPTTTAAALTITVQRRKSASSSGSSNAEGTSGLGAASFDVQRDGSMQGLARIQQNGAAVAGTAGAVLDQMGISTGERGTSQFSDNMFCRSYDQDSGKAPLISPGTINGVGVTVSNNSGGASSGSVSLITILEVLP